MKRVILPVLILLVFPGPVYAQGTWVPFTSTAVIGAPPIIEVLESNNSRTVIHVTIPGMWAEDTLINGTIYHILRIPDYGTMYNVAEPQLPAIRELVAIPPISNVSIEIYTSAPLMLTEYIVYPYQSPVPYGYAPVPFTIDTTIYSTNAFYPEIMGEVDAPALWQKIRVVNASCYPITYNPATRELNVFYDFIIQLNHYGTSSINPLLGGYPSAIDPMFEAIYKGLVINYAWLGIPTQPVSFIDYLVITATEYYDALQNFVFWKHKKGLRIKVAKPREIVSRPYFIQGDTLAIKNYIRNIFGTADQLAYVLMVGDENAVPMFCQYEYTGGGWIYSDHYYACINGDDNYPDLAIGRLSVTSIADVNAIVNKIFAYERTPAQDWAIGRVLMVSHYVTGFHITNAEIIANILIPEGFFCYDVWGEANYTNQDIKNYIEDGSPNYKGVSIVNYYGHGLYDEWWQWNHTESFAATDVHSLTNTYHYPVVYNCCCLNGAIQEPDEAMVEAWTRDPDGGGVGALGASREMWLIGDNPIPPDLFVATFNKDIYDVGYAINYAKHQLIQNHGPGGLDNARMFNWFGDPGISIWTCPEGCSTMIVTHPMHIGTGSTNFTVTVQYSEPGPVVWARVCLYKDEIPELFAVRYTDSNGRATFTIDPAGEGVLYVTVTKQNYRPYEGECRVTDEIGGPQSIASSSMPAYYALNQNLPDPFRGSTVISYQIPAQGNNQYVAIKIYDINGKYIRTLVHQPQKSGYFKILWNGKNDAGRKVSSGVYFVRFEANGYSATEKLIMLR